MSDDLPNKFGYTIEGAAKAVADKYGVSEATLKKQILDAAKQGELKVRHPHTGIPYAPEKRRDFYERIATTDLNRWFENSGVEYRLEMAQAHCQDSQQDAGDKLLAQPTTGPLAKPDNYDPELQAIANNVVTNWADESRKTTKARVASEVLKVLTERKDPKGSLSAGTIEKRIRQKKWKKLHR